MNQIEISIRAKGLPDKRYRLMVSLMRVDRPKYWNFHCFNCGSKICELVNRDVFDVADFYDAQNINNSGTLKHCKGTQPNGLACPYSYFFNML